MNEPHTDEELVHLREVAGVGPTARWLATLGLERALREQAAGERDHYRDEAFILQDREAKARSDTFTWRQRVEAAKAERDRLAAENLALREALRPFVEAARYRDPRCSDVELLCSENWFPPAEAALAGTNATALAGTTAPNPNIERLSAAVHQAYIDTCDRLGWSILPANRVPYATLSEDSKELDRASVRAVLAGIALASLAAALSETIEECLDRMSGQ